MGRSHSSQIFNHLKRGKGFELAQSHELVRTKGIVGRGGTVRHNGERVRRRVDRGHVAVHKIGHEILVKVKLPSAEHGPRLRHGSRAVTTLGRDIGNAIRKIIGQPIGRTDIFQQALQFS